MLFVSEETKAGAHCCRSWKPTSVGCWADVRTLSGGCCSKVMDRRRRFQANQNEKKIHNTLQTRALMKQLFDSQMANVADFDCFSQVVFNNLEDYKRIKQDPWYKEHLVGDHENFADTKKSM